MTHALKTKLGRRSILIVDDQFYTVGDYRIRLNDIDVTCEHANSLENAWKKIQTLGHNYGLVLLDLNMQESKIPALSSFAAKLGLQPTSRNHGRCLGLYLWRERNAMSLPYCYLSALPQLYGDPLGEFNDSYDKFLLDKASLLPSQLPDRLDKVLDDLKNIGIFLPPL